MLRILCDSTCDLPQSLLEQYHITVLPHIVVWGSQQFRDRVDLQPDEFYRRLEQDPRPPTTSTISQLDFFRAYQHLQAEGADEILALLVNSAFSAAYQNAFTAGQQMDFPVHVFDSRSTTGGLGLLVLAAARLCAEGAGAEQILARLEDIRNRLYLYVCLDTLEYVEKGGRIGKAARLIGTLLQIKPILDVNARSGEVIDIATTRTHRRAVEEFTRRFFQVVDPNRPFRVLLTHGGVPLEAAQLAERIQAEYHPLEVLTNITGPVLGINTGPRALALAGYNE